MSQKQYTLQEISTPCSVLFCVIGYW